MGKKKLLQAKRKGSAMALVLFAMVILLVLGNGLLSLGLHGKMQAIRACSQIRARSAADAGLVKALFEMNQKLSTPWDGNTLPQATYELLSNCDATLGYTVTGDLESGYIIESTGNSGRAERKVISTLKLADEGGPKKKRGYFFFFEERICSIRASPKIIRIFSGFP